MNERTSRGCQFEFESDGEMTIIYPDGTRDKTGLYPTQEDKEDAIRFARSTTGRSFLMRIRKQVLFDDRTGLYTAKAGEQIINKKLERINAIDFTGALSVVFCDLDHFGAFNKTHGHAAGDKVLAWFGGILSERTRNTDVVIRWGGEEFVIFSAFGQAPIRPVDEGIRERDFTDKSYRTGETNEQLNAFINHGVFIAARIKKAIEANPINVDGKLVKQTATFGTATMLVKPTDDVTNAYHLLLASAEKSEVSGKNAGRRSEIHPSETLYGNT